MKKTVRMSLIILALMLAVLPTIFLEIDEV